MKIKIRILRADTAIPEYRHLGDAGMDICNMGQTTTVPPLDRLLIPSGISVAVPIGYEIQIRPRSGTAAKTGLTVLNTPGTIDAGYRGELGIIVFNSSKDAVLIERGQRIAQIVLKKVEVIEWDITDQLDDTTRNDGGFGSTGA